LDHPFSAVDTPTAKHLFNRVLMGLLKGRTVLISSHNEALIAAYAHNVYQMKNGCINVIEYADLSLAEDKVERLDDIDFQPTENDRGTDLIQQEGKATGRLNLGVYQLYLIACGGFAFLFFFVGSFLLISFSKVIHSWWLKVWTDHNESSPSTAYMGALNIYLIRLQGKNENVLYYVQIYSLLGMLVIVASTFQYVVYIIGSYRGSVELHRSLLKRILRAPLRFFNITPTGRILNRFSNDMEQIDTRVMDAAQSFLNSSMQAATVLCVIGYIIPVFFLLIPLLIALYLYLANLYMTTSRELKRYESITRSPIISLFSETLAGLITIRAFGHENRFIQLNLARLDSNVRPRSFWILSNRWLSFRTEVLSSTAVLFASLAVVWGRFTSGLAALTISYTLQMSDALLYAIRDQADMELILNSVERAKEYLEIEQETSYLIPECRPVDEWPRRGSIEVSNLGVKYAQNIPFALQNIHFSVSPGEKLAIVGRTGTE
jgi:ABC-type multidrug transport system fused ATPase/permease subunit